MNRAPVKAILSAVLLFALTSASMFVVADTASYEDKVLRLPNGTVRVSTAGMAPNGCYSAGQAVYGAPEGVISVDGAVLITQPLRHNGSQVCTLALVPVSFHITTEVPVGTQAIVIYSLNKKTNSVTARALALPSD